MGRRPKDPVLLCYFYDLNGKISQPVLCYSVFSLWNSMNLWLCNSWQR